MEVVEYKSKGHPDTLTDLVVEACAVELDKYYIEKYSKLLHYNVDKALFVAGNANINFGGGVLLKNPVFILDGQVSNRDLELDQLLIKIIKQTVNNVLPNLKNNFEVEIRCGNVVSNLDDIAQSESLLANDTSFGVGHYPFSKGETVVKTIAKLMDALILKYQIADVGSRHSMLPLGELYKIMYVDNGVDIKTYISCPFYADAIVDGSMYMRRKVELQNYFKKAMGLNIIHNPDAESGHYYLTLTGSSVECGDSGQVGRGNRHNGLITPMQWMTMEAYSGKNNKNHTGKLYQKLAQEKAVELYNSTGKFTRVCLVSKIGKPITDFELLVEHFD